MEESSAIFSGRTSKACVETDSWEKNEKEKREKDCAEWKIVGFWRHADLPKGETRSWKAMEQDGFTSWMKIEIIDQVNKHQWSYCPDRRSMKSRWTGTLHCWFWLSRQSLQPFFAVKDCARQNHGYHLYHENLCNVGVDTLYYHC